MKEWQFDVLFIVGVGGALFLLIGPAFGLTSADNPTAAGGVGAILAFVLTQRAKITSAKTTASEKEEQNVQ